MSFLNAVTPQQSEGEVRDMYLRQQKPFGYVPNYALVFCHRPQVLAAWAQLQSTIRETVDDRIFELATLAAARELGSSYCSLAHANTLKRQYYDSDTLLKLLTDSADSPLSELERAVVSLARKVTSNASTVTPGDIDHLRELGMQDAEIFDVVAVASARCFFASLVDGLGAEPDSSYQAMPAELRSQLVCGRGISKQAPVSLSDPQAGSG